MMNKKFFAIGLISILALTGCANNAKPTNGENVQATTEAPVNDEQIKDQEKAAEFAKQLEEEEAERKEAEALKQKEAQSESEIKGLIALNTLMGQDKFGVAKILGKAEESTHLEKTNVLVGQYFKLNILDQIVSIEVVYNDEPQAVNFVNMTCRQTDDVDGFVAAIANELTAQFGESTVEKFIDVKGTKKREWYDDKLTYVLSVFEDNVYFDIYETDK